MKGSGIDMKTNTQPIFDLDSIWDDGKSNRAEKNLRPLAEKTDPLALSWASYHVWTKFPQRRWSDWNDLEAHEHDHAMALATRKYYRDRLMVRALATTNELTAFARDLYDICNGGVMRECHRGMLYRLPYFYVEDITTAELISRYSGLPNPVDNNVIPITQNCSIKTLEADCVIFHSRQRNETMQYWFRDTETGYPVKWEVKYDNPLRSIVDHLHRTQKFIKINAYWFVKQSRQGLGYLHPVAAELQ
jgi:hypothetical protein